MYKVIPTPVKDSFSPTFEFQVLDIRIIDREGNMTDPSRVKDGDTIIAVISLPFDKADLHSEIRFVDIDTWEKRRGRGRSVEHVKLGKEATAFLINLLAKDPQGRPWKRKWVRSFKNRRTRGNFGRYLFSMYLDDIDGNTFSVSQILRENGYEKQKGI